MTARKPSSQRPRPVKRAAKMGRRRKASWLKIWPWIGGAIAVVAIVWGAIQVDVLGRALSSLDHGVVWFASRLGLSLDRVEIEPMEYTTADEILKSSNVHHGQLIFRIYPKVVLLAIE